MPFCTFFFREVWGYRRDTGHAVPARRWGGALGSGLSHGDGAMSFTEGHGRRPWGAGTRQARLASAPGTADRRAPFRRETARRPSHLLNPEPRTSNPSGVPQPQAETPGGARRLKTAARRAEGKTPSPGGGGARQPSRPFCPRPTSVFSSRTPPSPTSLPGASPRQPGVPREPRSRRTRLPLVRCEWTRLAPSASFRSHPLATTGRARAHSADLLPSPSSPE